MCTYFKTETDVVQNLSDVFFSKFDFKDISIGRILSEESIWSTGLISEKTKVL